MASVQNRYFQRMAENSLDLESVIAQFGKLQISDGSTGVIKKRPIRAEWFMFPTPSKKYEYYGLALPEGAQAKPMVFKDLKEALSQMKINKGSRFKSFPTEKEAWDYAATPLKVINVPKPLPDSSPPSLTPQTYVKFRRLIEKGETEAIADMLWTNPRLMISRGDTPAILHEGTRMNALHVCAKGDRSDVCKLLLDLLESGEFMEKLYPSETEEGEILCGMRDKLLDFYLNMPDKTLGDTPLHYAAKFGSGKCLRIFLSHPLSCATLRNIDGKTPREISGSRCKDDEKLFDELKKTFENLYYVSVLRSQGSSPTVAKPLPRKSFVLKEGCALLEVDCGEDFVKTVNAFAGPMDKELAEKFYQHLKYPSSCLSFEETRVIHEVRVSDALKGIERTTRLLAHDLNVDYLEYFPFLNIFANLSSPTGLRALENYFEGIVTIVPPMPQDFVFATTILPKADENPLGHDVNVHLMRENRKLPDENEEPDFFTPPSSPEFHLAPSSPRFSSKNYKYIDSSKFTRLDVDVLIALGDVHVDKEKYPQVFRWKKHIEKKMAQCEKHEERKNITPLASVSLPRLKHSDVKSSPSGTPQRKINTRGRSLFKDAGG